MALTILAVGALCIACFFVGAVVGQTAKRGEDIKKAIPTPGEVIKHHKERKAVEAERNRISTILQNIDRYDGTSNGQKDVPRR
jgi:hypothetical protein